MLWGDVDMKAKSAVTSFDIAAVVPELKRLIHGRHVDNIYHIKDQVFVLKFRPDDIRLLIEPERRIHITKYELQIPKTPSPFCSALRKRLTNGKLIDVRQFDFERVVELDFESRGEQYQLVTELFPRGNLVLLDSKARIALAFRHIRMRDRSILPKQVFKHAPSSGLSPLEFSDEALSSLTEIRSSEIVRVLSRKFAIGGTYAEEALALAEVDKETPADKLSREHTIRISQALRKLTSQLDQVRAVVYENEDGEILDASPFPLKVRSDLIMQQRESMNDALDDLFSTAAHRESQDTNLQIVEREKSRISRILEAQQKELDKASTISEDYRAIGDSIYGHLHELNDLWTALKELRESGSGWNLISSYVKSHANKPPFSFVTSIDASKAEALISLDGQDFRLDLKQSPHANAGVFYEKSKAAQAKVRSIQSAILETQHKRDALKVRPAEKQTSGIELRRRRNREWYEKFRWFFTSEGFLSVGGRDASSNETLLRRHVETYDLIFHADIPGSPFFAVKTEGLSPGTATLSEVGQATACYSRGWREGLSGVETYWVNPDQVSKAAPSGEFVGRGSFMIRGSRNYLRGNEMRLSIGVTEAKDGERIVGGPPAAIRKKTAKCVDIVPGDMSQDRVAKLVLHRFRLRMDLAEEIRRFLPSGGSRVVDA